MNHRHNPIEGSRDLDFTPADFARVRALIYRKAGISLNESKQQMVYSRLARRLRAQGMHSFKAYLDLVEAGSDSEEVTEFINALTTNLTSFFREEYHFPIFADHIRQAKAPLRVWCAASSTGEEPYSIAMCAVETLGSFDVPLSIIATDIDTQVLAHASRGVYASDRVRSLSPERLRRFMLKGRGENAGYARVRPELRALIEFKPLNLLEREWLLQGQFDAVFCRNVMIYFDKPTQAAILSKMLPFLKRDALLFAGHSENFQYVCADLVARGKTVYSLDAGASAASAPSPLRRFA